eukprot:c14179_g1_i1 orf=251-700(+)
MLQPAALFDRDSRGPTTFHAKLPPVLHLSGTECSRSGILFQHLKLLSPSGRQSRERFQPQLHTDFLPAISISSQFSFSSSTGCMCMDHQSAELSYSPSGCRTEQVHVRITSVCTKVQKSHPEYTMDPLGAASGHVSRQVKIKSYAHEMW